MQEKEWKPQFIAPLEGGKPSGAWGESLRLSRTHLPAILLLTAGQFMNYEHVRGLQEVILHWVYKKKWNPSHCIPGYRSNPKNIRLLEPISDVFLAWLNLCESLHTIAPQGYLNAGECFTFIAQEMYRIELSEILNENGQSIFVEKNAWSCAQKIKKGINPFHEEQDPHRWNAIECALSTKESHPNIYKNLLKGSQRQKPHLGLGAAYSAFETSRQKDDHVSFELKDGFYMVVTGRGKSRTRLVYPDPCKKTIAETLSQSDFPDLIRNSS